MEDNVKEKDQLLSELERSNEELRLNGEIIANIAEGVSLVGVDGIIIYTNPKFDEMLGYDQNDLPGKHISIVTAPTEKSPEETVKIIMGSLEKNGMWAGEVESIKKNGIHFWNHVSISTFDHAEHGKVFLSVSKDITGQRETEEALRRSELWLSNTFNSLAEAVFVVTPARILKNVNKAAEKIFGYSRDELFELSTEILHVDNDHFVEFGKRVNEAFDKGEAAFFEFQMKRKSGEVFPTEHEVTLIKEDPENPIGIVSVVRDITERKKLEKALAFRSEIIEQVNDPVITTDLDFKINWVNQAFTEVYGYSLDDISGMSPDFLNAEPLSEDMQKDIYQSMSLGKSWRGEALNRRKDGTTFPCEMNVFPLKDEDGNAFAYAAHNHDMTERMKAREALWKAHNELEIKVRERTSELAESNSALKVLLKQREEDQKEFERNILSNVKHLVMPYLEKLKRNKPLAEELTYLNIIESNLQEIVAPFSQKLSSVYLNFTHKEIQIADLIKDGKQDKDIAEILNISLDTVKTHRRNIRKKLGISNTRMNLRVKLLSLS